MISNFLSGALGAVFGIITGLAVEWWKSERDDVMVLCRGFCDLVAEAADAGAEFWLTPPDDKRYPFVSARVGGFQSRISGYCIVLVGRVDDESLDEITSRLARLFKSLTGGDADDPSREVSREKAAIVHDEASAAIIAIRQAMFERVSFNETLTRWVNRHWPNKRWPIRRNRDQPFSGSD